MENTTIPSYEEFFNATVKALRSYEQFENLNDEEMKKFEEDIKYEYEDAIMAYKNGRTDLDKILPYSPKLAAYGIFMLY